MRADRLVSVLLLLQRRGQVTAAEVAAELEVSERTARRDLEALGVAGLPIYSMQGRGGGWRLAGGGRTDLSGLTAPEARALFLVAGPSADSPELRAALRKLVRALPESFRDAAEAATSAVVVDPTGWDRRESRRPPPPLLDDAQRAVVEGREVELGYVDRRWEPSSRLVQPLGLASKGDVWYLIGDTRAGLRTFRVDRIITMAETGRPAARPPDFDLAATWATIADEVEERRTPVRARARVQPGRLELCRWRFGNRIRIGPTADDGCVDVELRGHSIGTLAVELAGLGDAVDVQEPAELRVELAGIGAALVARYAGDGQAVGSRRTLSTPSSRASKTR